MKKELKQLDLIDYDYSFNHLIDLFVNPELERAKKRDEELSLNSERLTDIERQEELSELMLNYSDLSNGY
jgi:hypothetical protein